MNRQLNQMSGGRRPDFTPKQGQDLAFIDVCARLDRRPPAEADMQPDFGVTPPSVHPMILHPRTRRSHSTRGPRRAAKRRGPRLSRGLTGLAGSTPTGHNLRAEVLVAHVIEFDGIV